jgi:hypothetical protein
MYVQYVYDYCQWGLNCCQVVLIRLDGGGGCFLGLKYMVTGLLFIIYLSRRQATAVNARLD